MFSLLLLAGLAASAVAGAGFSRQLLDSKRAYFLAEAGGEDVAYRASVGLPYSSEEVISIDGFFATTTTENVGGILEITAKGDVSDDIRKVKLGLEVATGVAFNYGVQVGDGGVQMEQSSMITGNLYSNGPVGSFNSNEVLGDVVSAGPAGTITGVHATGSAYAHNIVDSEIEGDAYYQTIFGSTVWGTLYPDSPDQPFADMPISDELIDSWKQMAAVSEITSPCPYIIDSNDTIGPVKITCDLEIQGTGYTLNIAGPVWVEGDIEVTNSPIIKADPSLGKKSVAIIADNESDRLTSGKIILRNSTVFEGSGTDGSYVLVLSQNNSAENGGGEDAIAISQSVEGELLLYAPHGKIFLNNSSDLREVTAYQILMRNAANVIYETGLANLLFDSGPAGGFVVTSWREIE